MRTTRLLLITLTFAALLAVACAGSGRGQPSAMTTTATTTTSTSTMAQTWDVQTGIAPVDRFLNLIANGDLRTIAAEAAYRPIECEPDLGIQDAPLYCTALPAGVTEVEGIYVGCFPFWAILEDELPDSIEWLSDDAMELETVHRTDKGEAAYALTFIEEGNPPAPAFTRTVVYLTDDGHLEGYASCGEFTEPAGVVRQLWP